MARTRRPFVATLLVACLAVPVGTVTSGIAAWASHDDVELDDHDEEDAVFVDLLDEVIPTSPDAQPCAEGEAPLYYEGEPVVVDENGTPICVSPQPDGQPGEVVPGQPGEDGGWADSQGVPQPGEAGEPAP